MAFRDVVLLLDEVGLCYFLSVNIIYFILIAASFPLMFRRCHELKIHDINALLKSTFLPSVCVIVPMHNEEKEILASVEALCKLSYPSFSVIVVNDGSTDESLEQVKQAFQLRSVLANYPCILRTSPVKGVFRSESYPQLMVIDKERGGKGDALNAGINATQDPLILTVDADTIVEKEALLRMVPAFVSEKGVGGQGGTLRILTKGQSGKMARYLTKIQSVEYLRAFLYGRLGWNSFGGNLIVSGAFGLFDRAAILEAGGYVVGEVSEDIEITVNLTRFLREKHQKRAIQFMPDPVAWTRGPETIGSLGRQRERWHRGLIETVMKHRSILFNPKYGLTAFMGFPYLIFAEMVQPIMEVLVFLGIIVGLILGVINMQFILFFMLATWGIHTLLTFLALTFEVMAFERRGSPIELLRLGGVALLENLGFRQICVVWRLFAFYRYLTGYKKWH